MHLTPTCHDFYILILRLIQARLQIAAGLDGHTLYLECHHPSARLTAARLFCTSLGTDGLPDGSALSSNPNVSPIGKISKLSSLYTRFQPQRKEPEVARRPRPGDIPGSRTHGISLGLQAALPQSENELVTETITVDAHDLFSQLSTLAYLGKRESTKGLLTTIQELSDGTIRVWRTWLAKQCQSRSWTDDSTVQIVMDGNYSSKSGSSSVNDPTKDPSVLWVNTRDNNMGIRFNVTQRKWRGNNPVLFSNEDEVAVSYVVEFQGELSSRQVGTLRGADE